MGYEVDAAGETSLIIFDPETYAYASLIRTALLADVCIVPIGRSIPKPLRNAAIASISDTGEGNHGSRADSTETSRKRRKTGQQSLLNMISKTKKDGHSTDPIIVIESDEEIDSSGWVRKKVTTNKSDIGRDGEKKKGANQLRLLRDAFDWNKNPNAILKHFRVNMKSLR